jgi:hypothetical protein
VSELPRLNNEDDLAGALLRSAADDAPPTRSRAAVAAALGVSAGAAGLGSAHATGAATKATVASKLGTSLALKVGAVVVAVGTTVAVHHVIVKPPRTAEPHAADVRTARVPAATPIVTIDAAAARQAEPIAKEPVVRQEVAASPRPTRAVHIAPAHAPTHADDAPAPAETSSAATPVAPSLADELALLDSAVSALHRHDAAAALATLDAYDRRFPTGTLVPEATAARIEATLAIGDSSRARELAAQFLADHPNSPVAARVRALVASSPP